MASVDDAAAALNCSARKVRQLISNGTLAAVRIDRLVRVPRLALLTLMRTGTVNDGDDAATVDVSP